jgi:hypothetical protein
VSQSEEVATVVRQPLPVTGGSTSRIVLQQRAARMWVRALPHARYQLARVGPAGTAGLGILIAACVAAIALLVPAQRSVVALRSELIKAGHPPPAATARERSPLQFTAALPLRAEIPALLGVVLVKAAESGIVLEQGRYTFSPAASNRLARYTLEFPVKGDYSNIRGFIDKTLLAIPALGLDKLHVERKNVGDALVSADVGFVVYLRGG